MRLFFIFFIPTILFFNRCTNTSTTATNHNSTNKIEALKTWLASASKEEASLQSQVFAHSFCSQKEAKEAVDLIYDYQRNLQIKELETAWKNKQFQQGEHILKIKVKTFGKAPKDGHSLYISMHGGGGAAPEVNDQQWENQIRLYQLEEGIYLAPRAPTNTWNLWHQSHIDDLFDQLIKAAILVEGVNPNKIYLTGYSAGGDGTFQLAPRMADRFAAAAMMAGHPNETTPEGLRNLPFALYMGALDGAYERNKKAKDWKILLDSLQKNDPGAYLHQVGIIEEKGHWMDRADTTGIQWMAQFARNPIPNKVVWKQDDRHHQHFYWLETPPDLIQTGQRIVVECQGNAINILENYSETLYLNLNDALLNLDEPVIVQYQGKEIFKGNTGRTIYNIWKHTLRRMDKELAFSSMLIVNNNTSVIPAAELKKE